jgi:formyltetrahydrofolate-dependent phosphoribosylglycinamide formyltransferase
MRLVVLISGSGTNLQAIMDAIAAKHLKAEIVAVVSNRKAAYGLVRAEQAGIEILYFPLKPYSDAGKPREDYDRDLAEKLKKYEADLFVLAGWMHIFTPAFFEHFAPRMINLHPALPKDFIGKDTIERAFEAAQEGKIKHSGVVVHEVIPELDSGDIIVQAEVPILPSDSLEDFAARIHATEHKLLVQAIAIVGDKLS